MPAPAAPPKLKVCGLTRVEDAEAAVSAGAWAAGVVLAPGSPRRATLDEAAAIAAHLKRRALVVGVFVNQPLDEVIGVAEAVGLTGVQLHGDEGPSFVTEVQRRAGVKVIKAAGIDDRADVQALDAFRNADFHLMDAGPAASAEAQRGGTGRTFEWSLARVRRSHVPLVVAGGIGPENAAEAVVVTRPWAIDASSSLELAPGIKDHDRIAALADAVREGGERLAELREREQEAADRAAARVTGASR